MTQPQQILFPTDFSEQAANAQQYACAMAEAFGATLHVLHVAESHWSSTPQFAMGLVMPATTEESDQEVERRLAELLDEAWCRDRTVVRTAVHGTPFLEIVRYAREHDIDLIVMGTHGRSGLAHVMLGSVAERVVRKAPCPVLTVRPEGHQFVMP